jgi:peptidyl-prolyl cis-trans isomerase SurA
MRQRPFLLALVVGTAVVGGGASRAQATIAERVVAVIGERPVLWTDLLHRAVATRLQIRTQTHDPNVISVQEQAMYKELVDRLIDDRLEEQQADKAHITIAPEEIDRGIANIAAQAQQQQGRPVTAADVMAEVLRRGLTEQDFRDEIRRQILEGKLIELRVRPRVRVTEQDGHAAYQHWVNDLQTKQMVEARILPKRIPPGSTPQQAQAVVTLAETLAHQAQNGADFCQLIAQYSDDTATRDTCGTGGPQSLHKLFPAIQNLVKTVPPGTVSDATRMTVGPDEVVVIVMPMPQPRTPEYEAVKNEMMQQALLEGLERARKQWLDELRHNVYIDVRL